MPLQQLANTDIQTGIITGDRLASNTITSTQFQTNSIESYLNTQGTNLGMRNRIINGAMMIDQRNAGANTVPSSDGLYQIDRWQSTFTAGSKFSVQQNAGSVTPPVGYTNYLGITSTSAFSVTSTDKLGIQQNIEGFNTADLMWGTAYAKTVTLSAWVYSSLTGTFGGSIRNNDSSRSYPFTFNIPSANTWTYINITIPGDTTGTWIGATNACGMRVMFSLGAGSSASGTAGTWAGSNYWSATGATSVVGTSGATFYITGVQLEKGSQATPFEFRHYTNELTLCQRYFEKSWPQSLPIGSASTGYQLMHRSYTVWATVLIITGQMKVTKRTSSPTFIGYDNAGRAGKCNINDNITDPNNITLTGIGGSDTFVVAQCNYNVGNGLNGLSLAWSCDAEL